MSGFQTFLQVISDDVNTNAGLSFTLLNCLQNIDYVEETHVSA